jgi:hypothetical protein
MIESLFAYVITHWPLTFGAVIVITIGLSGTLLSERREKMARKKIDEGVMETSDDYVGVATMVGTYSEALELHTKINERNNQPK